MTDAERKPGREGSERASLAHQLNNALAVILGNAQVALLDPNRSSKSEDHLREILVAAQRARDLIRQVLTLPPPPSESGAHQLTLDELRRAASMRPPEAQAPCILYIDDEEPLVVLAVRHLKRLGYEVVGATSAEQALQLFRKDPDRYTAVMTDLNMPGMTGLALAAQILAERPALPVVVASGFVNDDLQAEAAAIGVRHVVYKPSTVEELANVVHHILAGGGP